ncbi:hypothetical protein FACS1894140_3280 [Spirochaetia bacterium]|nr:hypothetical protein FACS1894140_3280 [Spirochaetia bacterium]
MVFLIYICCIASFMILAKVVQSVIIKGYAKIPREIFIILTYLIFGVCGFFFFVITSIQLEVPKLTNRIVYEVETRIRHANPGFVFIEEGIDVKKILEIENTANQIVDVCINMTASPETMSAQLAFFFFEDSSIAKFILNLFAETIYDGIIYSLDIISPNIRNAINTVNSYRGAERPIEQILFFLADENGKISLFSILDNITGTFNTYMYLETRRRQTQLLMIAAVYIGVLLVGYILSLLIKKNSG